MRRHGTRSCYVGGCRCDDCRAAGTEYSRQRRRSVPRDHPVNWGEVRNAQGRRLSGDDRKDPIEALTRTELLAFRASLQPVDILGKSW